MTARRAMDTNLCASARMLARDLRTEMGQLALDARRFDERGLPRYAADIRALQKRLAHILAEAEAVVAAADAT